jgi:hypothetical protein
MSETGTTRREVLTKAVYVAPVILTLAAVPAFASAGSGALENTGASGNFVVATNPGSGEGRGAEKRVKIGSWFDDILVSLGISDQKYSQ